MTTKTTTKLRAFRVWAKTEVYYAVDVIARDEAHARELFEANPWDETLDRCEENVPGIWKNGWVRDEIDGADNPAIIDEIVPEDWY